MNMNKTKNGELQTSAEAKARGLVRVNSNHRQHLKNLTIKDCKSRITILIDADILEFFKERASQKGNLPYQTQINNELRKSMENLKQNRGEVITMDMLDNPNFIATLADKLKAA
jgi:uncharacterized protein (DUF4415 family)